MFTPSHRLVFCVLIVVLAACSDRKSSRTEVTSRPFYPLNPGCTFDGKPGSADDMSQMHNAKVISDECYAPPTPKLVSSRTFYPSNPGCTFDGKPGAGAEMSDMQHAKVISEACFAAPASTVNGMSSETSRTMYLSNPGCKIDGQPGTGADAKAIVAAKVISQECFSAP